MDLSRKLVKTPFPAVNNLIGGFPKGRFSTVAGPQQAGKGTLLLQTISHNQGESAGFAAIYTDAENALERTWMDNLGVDSERLLVQTYNKDKKTMEDLLEESMRLISGSNAIDMWVIDSVSALLPKRDQERELEKDNMMTLAKKLGEFFRKCNMLISPRPGYDGCAVVIIGQVYDVPTTTGASITDVRGGNALKHWAHVRLNMRRGPRDESPDPVDVVCPDGVTRKVSPGWMGRIKMDKSRQNSNEGMEILVPFYLGRGFDSKESTIGAAIGLGIVERSVSMYSCDLFPEGKIRGRDAVMKFLSENEEAYKALSKRVDESSLKKVIESNTEDVE